MNRLSSFIDSPLQSLRSVGETSWKIAKNIAIGSAIVIGGLWVLFNVPGIIPSGHLSLSSAAVENTVFSLQQGFHDSMLQTLAA